MAIDKKSFVLYSDLIHTVSKMPKDKAGELFLHILKYVNDEAPITEDLIIQLTFEPIKQQLNRDLKKYKEKKIQWSEAGKRSAELREIRKKERSLTDVENDATDSTVNVNVNVNDNVNDTVIKEKRKKEKVFNFRKSMIDFGFSENLIEDWLLIRKNKKATNSKTAFDLFVKQVEKANRGRDEILELCIAKDWKGFNAGWLQNLQNGNSVQKNNKQTFTTNR